MRCRFLRSPHNRGYGDQETEPAVQGVALMWQFVCLGFLELFFEGIHRDRGHHQISDNTETRENEHAFVHPEEHTGRVRWSR